MKSPLLASLSLATAPIAALLVAACSSDGAVTTAPPSGAPGGAASSAAPPAEGRDASAGAPSIVGRWISETVETRQDAQHHPLYLRRDFTTTSTRSEARLDFYADADGAAPTVSVVVAGPYTLGAPWSAVAGSFQGTFTFDDARITPRAQGLVDALNAAAPGTCGSLPFRVNVEQSVNDTGGCAALGIDLRQRNTEYDIVKLDGDELSYGARPDDGGGLDTPGRRPTALQVPLVRVADRPDPRASIAALGLPGTAYYPESLGASADGALYIGSVSGAGIVKFAPGATQPAPFAAKTALKSVAGVVADDARGELLVCENDLASLGVSAPVLHVFDLATEAEKGRYPFPAPGFCNDVALGDGGARYVTDSFGAIYTLAGGAASLVLFSKDPSLAPATAGGFGADGIAWDPSGAVYVGTFTDGRLLRVPVKGDGSAGAAESVAVTPALSKPDAIRRLADGTLLVVEGAGRLTKVTVQGATARGAVLRDGLDAPTSAVVSGGVTWVTEGQIDGFLSPDHPKPRLPFLVRRASTP